MNLDCHQQTSQNWESESSPAEIILRQQKEIMKLKYVENPKKYAKMLPFLLNDFCLNRWVFVDFKFSKKNACECECEFESNSELRNCITFPQIYFN